MGARPETPAMPRPQTAVVQNYELGPAALNSANFDTQTSPGTLQFRVKRPGANVEFHIENPIPSFANPIVPGTVTAPAGTAVNNQITVEVSPDNVQWFPVTDTNHGLIVAPIAPGASEPVGSGSGSGSGVVGTINLTNFQIVPSGHIRGAFNLRGGGSYGSGYGPDTFLRFRGALYRLLVQIRTPDALDEMRI